MEDTFMLIGHVTSLIPYKDSSRPHRLAVVEAKSRKDAARRGGGRCPACLVRPCVRGSKIAILVFVTLV